jgi:hypothetical protein
MTTPADLINLALKMSNVLGVGQTASAEDMNDAFKLMQMMLAQWQRRRYLVYHLVNYSIPATGAQFYTIGPGGNLNVPRPAKIESAFFRQVTTPVPNQPDYPLSILQAREDYDRILLKQLQSFPQYVFYDSAFPMGNLYVWPIPNGTYEVHITVMEQLQSFPNINTVIVMPPEYEEAIMYNLALRLYAMYGLPPNPVVVKAASVALNILEAANTQIPRLRMPIGIIRGGGYNIFGDVFR